MAHLPILLFLLVLIAMSLPGIAQSGFGGYSRAPYGSFPGFGGLHGSAFDSFHPKRNTYYSHGWPHEDPYAYHDYACPASQPITYSRWRETSDGRLATKIILPGVRHEDQRLWLGDDGSTLHLKAARSPSTQGGRHCLPR